MKHKTTSRTAATVTGGRRDFRRISRDLSAPLPAEEAFAHLTEVNFRYDKLRGVLCQSSNGISQRMSHGTNGSIFVLSSVRPIWTAEGKGKRPVRCVAQTVSPWLFTQTDLQMIQHIRIAPRQEGCSLFQLVGASASHAEHRSVRTHRFCGTALHFGSHGLPTPFRELPSGISAVLRLGTGQLQKFGHTTAPFRCPNRAETA